MRPRDVQHKVRAADVKIGAGIVVPHELFGADHAMIHTEGQNLHVARRLHLAQARVIGIQNERAALAESVTDGNLFAEHAVQVAEAFQVASADVRNHGNVRLGGERKRADFVGATRAHFHHGGLVGMLELEQRHRHTDMVVEVPLRGVGAELHRKDGLGHLLGGGLAVTSRNGDLLHLEAALVTLGEFQQCLGGIIHRGIHVEGILLDGFLINDAHQCTILFHEVNKLVGVKACALDRPEHNALGLFTRIHAEIHLAP